VPFAPVYRPLRVGLIRLQIRRLRFLDGLCVRIEMLTYFLHVVKRTDLTTVVFVMEGPSSGIATGAVVGVFTFS